ncbi:putative myosin-binding protein 5 isoform X2 [Tasmannia lanceolata]|uniref:putative myosin-binding protein 5 isoform X2 n=1 Tax=Tasmannia lanceolata TaxID=3420 RepID=UPI004062CEC0
MAAKRTLKQIIQNKLGTFPAALIYIVLEWMLIILLFIDGLLAFTANEFARYFGLKIPCLLCTRIDHVLVRRDPDFYYNDSICQDHKKDVSSLVHCHIHGKLSDARHMCKGCLMSFSMENRSNSDPNRSLAEIVGSNLDNSIKEDRRIGVKTLLNEDDGEFPLEKSSIRQCFCCNEPMRSRSSYMKGPVQMLSDGSEVPETLVPSNVAIDRESYLIMRNEESLGFDPLSHINYRELRLTSDTESEIVDEDEGSSAIASDNEAYKDEVIDRESKKMVESLEKIKPETPIMVSEEQLLLLEPQDLSLREGFPHKRLEALDGSTGLMLSDSNVEESKVLGGGQYRDPSRQPSDNETSSGIADGLMNHAANGDTKAADASKASTTSSASGLESLKESIMGKVQGESLLHRLKRQVRLDRKSLIALCTELDQERSASEIAANEAMAMITRLQEEKSAVQMEALQYQRMMEEQAEYDQEALQVMKRLLLNREKEMKLLEEEVEVYRERFECEFEKDEGAEGTEYVGTVLQDNEGYKELINKNLQKLKSRSHSFSGMKSERRAFF